MSTLLDRIEAIARVAHSGQYRRGGAPYISHPMAVMHRVKGEDAKAVALLHDILEDTEITAGWLLAKNIPIHIVYAVVAITKNRGEDYQKYLARVKANPLARMVKIEDMRHNLEDSPKPETAERYRKGIQYLLGN